MGGVISINKLKEHPKNSYYFTDVDGEKYEEIKRSIQVNGIRDPLKVTTSYTVISGHQRLKIAKELGFTEVPVEIVDVDEWQAEYLLIAENVERRGQAETDPIKKARIAQFLKEYWGVRDGSANPKGTKIGEGQNAFTKKVSDIAETIGETERTTKRILKLNDLIPELQALVSAGKLGTTAAEQLAYLTESEQRALLEVVGEKISETSVQQAKEYRKQAKEAESKGEDFAEKLRKAEQRIKELEEMAKQKQVERVEVMPPEKARRLSELERKVKEIEQERDNLEASLAETYARLQELEKADRARHMQEESPLYDIYRTLSASNGRLSVVLLNERFISDLIQAADKKIIDRLSAEAIQLKRNLDMLQSLIDRESKVIVIDQFEEGLP